MTTQQKWEKTGLLKELNDYEASDMANQLESLSNDVLALSEDRAKLANILLPIQRRVGEHQLSIMGDYLDVDGKKFMKLDDVLMIEDRTDWPHALDAEVEICRVMTDKIKAFCGE